MIVESTDIAVALLRLSFPALLQPGTQFKECQPVFWTLSSHKCLYSSLSFKRNLTSQLLLLYQAVSLVSFSLSKEKHDISNFYLSAVTDNLQNQGKRCHERPSGIVSRLNATLCQEAFDRSITPPCLCRPLKNRLI